MILTDVSDTIHADSLALFALNIEILLADVNTRIFRNIRQVIEGKKYATRAVPEATPDELNEYFVGAGPRVAVRSGTGGSLLSFPVVSPE